MASNKVIFFDGYCNLCHWTVRFIRKRDKIGKFRFTALQSVEGKEMMNQPGLVSADLSTVIYKKGEAVFTRSTAILKILNDLGGIWRAFHLLILIPPFLRDAVYNFIAVNRYSVFGRNNSCNL